MGATLPHRSDQGGAGFSPPFPDVGGGDPQPFYFSVEGSSPR
jgi:hypothetical protein